MINRQFALAPAIVFGSAQVLEDPQQASERNKYGDPEGSEKWAEMHTIK